jgi:hypothetical protein
VRMPAQCIFSYNFPPAHVSSVKILPFYKCQIFNILQVSKFYHSTSVKILQFSSFAQPQSKRLLLLVSEFIFYQKAIDKAKGT